MNEPKPPPAPKEEFYEYTPEQEAALDAELVDCQEYTVRGSKILQTPAEHERMEALRNDRQTV